MTVILLRWVNLTAVNRREGDRIEDTVAACAAVPRSVQALVRNERWFKDTLPHLPAHVLKQSFRVMPATFHYLVNVCRLIMKRTVTACVQPSRWKRESALLYTSCAPVRRTTIANSFGLGRSTVNELYREVCRAIVPVLERNWVKMVSAAELPDHIREFQAALEFPQGMRALDGCHFSVSPPNVNASDYHNKGW